MPGCGCRAKATGALAEAESTEALKKLLYLASRSEEKPVSQAAAAAFQYVLRYAPAAEAQQVGCRACAGLDCIPCRNARIAMLGMLS